ncbi:MAG: hypothetical protein AAF598_20825 [Bacteroidota bacterium]
MLEQNEWDPYANIYMAYGKQSGGARNQALPYYQKIVDAPNARSFWYILKALDFLGQHDLESDLARAKAYYQQIIDIGWNMNGLVNKAQSILEKLPE